MPVPSRRRNATLRRSLENLKTAISLVDHAMIFNNTSNQIARLMVEVKGRIISRHHADLPLPVELLLADLSPQLNGQSR